jgi:hypothetical protein
MTEVVSLHPFFYLQWSGGIGIKLLTPVLWQELGIIFREKEIISSKILRDSMGNSRGVGFAR